MKLFYIANARIPTEKAHGYQIARMCHEYSALGLDVELMIPRRRAAKDKNLFAFYGLPRSFSVRTLNTPDVFRFGNMLGRISFFLQVFFFFLRLIFISFPKNSAVITRHPEIAWLAQKKRATAIYECHDWFGKNKRVSLWFLHNVQHIVTTNKFIKNEFLKNDVLEEKIIVAPNGVDYETYALNISKHDAINALELPENVKENMRNTFVALYTGSFTTMGTDKGISTILDSLKDLGNVYFVAVGGNEKDISYYKKMASKDGVSAKTYFMDRVNKETLARFQRAADVLLMPFPRKAHYEYFMSPLKTFEYMASGRPIIASTLPSIKEILKDDSAFFVPPEDHEALAKQITFIQNNQIEVQKYAEKAQEKVVQYTWQNRAEYIANKLY